MHHGLKTEIYRIIFISVSAVIFGLMTGLLLPSLLAAGFFYSCWLLGQTRRFYLWLEKNTDELPPDSSGIWGDIFEVIYKSRRQRIETQKHLLMQLQQVRGFTSALKEGLVLINPKGIITWWNESAEKLFSFNESTDLNQPIINLIRTPAFISFFQAGNYNEPIDITSPQDPGLVIQIQISVYGDQERLLVAQDVTRLRQLEKMRKDFVANVSHELRTPLTVVRGYIETMSDQLDTFDQIWHKPLQQMHKQTIRMSDIVSDLSTLSRLETSNTTTEEDEINLFDMISNIRQDALLLEDTKPINISIEGADDICLIGSNSELQSALSNLVFNAVKYSKEEGANIQVVWKKTDNGLMLSVNDNGIGMDPKHIPRLTERFY
ncbi:MAG: DUF3329 domain-containing protein, partial [Pseudomonadales bacterium]|nr:DUF3329 domain-containing protein [Pseudomonadales bacterium]